MQEKKASIIRMLEMANEREISIIYHFVLHLLESATSSVTDEP